MSDNDFSKKLISLIEKEGIYKISKYVGGYKNLLKRLGDYEISEKYKLDTILKFLIENGPLGLGEIGEDPIFYGSVGNEIRQIEYLGKFRVTVDVYDDDSAAHLGEFKVDYEALPKRIINEIFEILVNIDENL